MKPYERAFEEHIAGSLVEDGGYRAVKLSDTPDDLLEDREDPSDVVSGTIFGTV